MKQRAATIERKTKETDISLTINLDGTGENEIATGIPFFDHMLNGFARHGLFDLKVHVTGDLEVDSHHTIEDTGIVLGQAIAAALGEKKGIKRYGSFLLPMDETLAMCAVDLSGRPYLNYQAEFTVEKLGTLDTEMIRKISENHRILVTIEENVLTGGFGEQVEDFVMREDIPLKVRTIGISDDYVEHGNVDVLRKEVGLDRESIVKKVIADDRRIEEEK